MPYIEIPLESEPTDLAEDAFEYLEEQVPGWLPSPGNLEAWLVEANSLLAGELRDLAALVPDSIFEYYGASVLGLPPLRGDARDRLDDLDGDRQRRLHRRRRDAGRDHAARQLGDARLPDDRGRRDHRRADAGRHDRRAGDRAGRARQRDHRQRAAARPARLHQHGHARGRDLGRRRRGDDGRVPRPALRAADAADAAADPAPGLRADRRSGRRLDRARDRDRPVQPRPAAGRELPALRHGRRSSTRTASRCRRRSRPRSTRSSRRCGRSTSSSSCATRPTR